MKNKFKVGDIVKYTSVNHDDSRRNPLWGGIYGKTKGTIKTINVFIKNIPIKVIWNNGEENVYNEVDLELIHRKQPFGIWA